MQDLLFYTSLLWGSSSSTTFCMSLPLRTTRTAHHDDRPERGAALRIFFDHPAASLRPVFSASGPRCNYPGHGYGEPQHAAIDVDFKLDAGCAPLQLPA